MKLQYEKIKEIVENDCKLRYRYCNKKGQTCVIGALLLKAGVSRRKLISYQKKGIYYLQDMQEILRKEYGINETIASALQKTNDDFANIKERKILILGMLAKMDNET